MAEVDTVMLSQEHSAIRHEQAEQAATIRQQNADRTSDIRYDIGQGVNEVVKEGIKEAFNIRGDVKDARHDVSGRISDASYRTMSEVDRNADRLDSRFFDVARDTQDIRAQIISAQQAMVTGFLGVSKDTELGSLKTQLEMQKNTSYLSDKIEGQAEKTRELINELKNADLNRMLIERNNEIVEHRHEGRHWRGHFDNAQYSNLVSQINALNSQFAETRQGINNFGTMAGVGLSSTNNNVR